MTELIDRQKLMDDCVWLCGGVVGDPYSDGYMEALDNVEKVIREFPAVEAVEVVRCEDCKYMVLDTVHGIDWCNHALGLCSEVYATDFCCHGERKDNG